MAWGCYSIKAKSRSLVASEARFLAPGVQSIATLSGLAVHLRQNSGIQIALIERHLAAPDDRRDNAGKRLEAANRANRIRMFFGDITNLE